MAGLARRGAALLIGVLSLSGCASEAPQVLASNEVQIGTCKDKSVGEEMLGVSDTSPAVPCTDPHALEIYDTGAIPDEISKLGPERPGSEILSVNSPSACPYESIRPYLGATDLDSQWGVGVWVKYPTRSEWADGVRTVLCNLVVSSSEANQPPRVSLPLKDALKYQDSARIRLCRSGDQLLTCDREHDAERAGDVDAAGTDADRAARCRTRANDYTGDALDGETPTVVMRDGTAECWITSPTVVRGTLRGGLAAR